MWPGLGNSAAFSVVGSAAMLLASGNLQLPVDDHARKLASDWAFTCETVLHGRPSGVDNTICAFGGMIRYTKGGAMVPEKSGPKLRVIVVFSNQLRSTKVLAKKVFDLMEKYEAVFNGIFDAMDSLAKRASVAIDSLMQEPESTSHHACLQVRLREFLFHLY